MGEAVADAHWGYAHSEHAERFLGPRQVRLQADPNGHRVEKIDDSNQGFKFDLPMPVLYDIRVRKAGDEDWISVWPYRSREWRYRDWSPASSMNSRRPSFHPTKARAAPRDPVRKAEQR